MKTTSKELKLSTNAERQRRYRERALRDPDGPLLTRLQVMLSPRSETPAKLVTRMLNTYADGCLKRICEAIGKIAHDPDIILSNLIDAASLSG